jgi:hypothetical protein
LQFGLGEPLTGKSKSSSLNLAPWLQGRATPETKIISLVILPLTAGRATKGWLEASTCTRMKRQNNTVNRVFSDFDYLPIIVCNPLWATPPQKLCRNAFGSRRLFAPRLCEHMCDRYHMVPLVSRAGNGRSYRTLSPASLRCTNVRQAFVPIPRIDSLGLCLCFRGTTEHGGRPGIVMDGRRALFQGQGWFNRERRGIRTAW